MRANSISPKALFAVLIATLFSGAAGLSYEIVWSRMLVVPLGNSTDATALVLCAFMLGMALGSRFIGNIADRIQSPVRLYIGAEVVLGLYAIVMPFIVPVLENEGMDWLLRFVLGAVLVALPAVMMGASIPVLVKVLSFASEDISKRVGLIYGLNTVGGALGAAYTGFWGIAENGLTTTSFLAAVLSLFAAAIVWTASRLWISDNATGRSVDIPPANETAAKSKTALAALLIAAAGGFAMLGSEVLWARILTFVFGHDTYAFAILLVIALLGMGLGGIGHRALAKRDQGKMAALMLGLLGASLLLSYFVAAALVIKLGRDPFEVGEAASLSTSLWLEFYREFLYAPVLIFLPAFFAGVALPAACTLYTSSVGDSGRRVGVVILVNGIAASAGAILTSFIFVPSIGIHETFILLTGLLVITASIVTIFVLDKPSRPVVISGGAALAVIVLAVAVVPFELPKIMLQKAVGERHQEIIYYDEGRTGTVSVTKNKLNGERQLFMNAVNEVTTRLVHDQSFKMLGHLGPLLHPDPQKGLMICFGAGISAGAALRHPLKKLDVIELSKSIPGAAEFFAKENNRVFEDDRLQIHINDGRQYLLRSKTAYDVIMVDSTHPKAVDSWILYTVEFYNLIRDHLSEDGIAVQWVPLHGLSEREFKIIVRTFFEAFPNTTLWLNVGYEVYGEAAYAKLVGTLKPLAIDYKELALRLKEPRINKDLQPYGMNHPMDLLDSYITGPLGVRSWTNGLPVQSDDRPFLPYITKYSTGRRMNASLMIAARSSIAPILYKMGSKEPEILKEYENAFEAQGFLMAGLLDQADNAWPKGQKIPLFEERLSKGRDYYLSLAKLYKDDPKKLFEIGSYLGNLGHKDDALSLYKKALRLDKGNSRIRINKALLLIDMDRNDDAVAELEAVVEAEPDNPLALYNLGVAYMASGDAASAMPRLIKTIKLNPDLFGASLSLADVYRRLGNLKKAESVLKTLTRRAEWMADAWDMLGLVEADRKNWSQAKKYHSKALMLDPFRAKSHYNIGIALQEEGRLKESAEAYKAALKIQPNDAEAQNNLGLVFAAAGLFDKAAKHHRKALDIAPHYPEAAYNLGLAYKAAGRTLLSAEAFGLALTMAPDLEPARKQIKQMGLDQARIEISSPDAGLTDTGQ